jgi:hypothetical protein
MGWVSTEGTHVREVTGTGGCLSTTMWADIVQDADDSVTKCFVDPLSIFFDETFGLSLMVFVKVVAPTEIAFRLV